MNTNAIVIGIAVIVVLGAGTWLLMGKSEEGGKFAGETVSGSGSFSDFYTRSGSWKCAVRTETQGVTSEGVVYVSDGKIRADFDSTVSGNEVTSFMIHDGTSIYTWSSLQAQGVRMDAMKGEESNGEAGAGPQGDVDYECAPWAADATVFVPPATIEFMELGAGVPLPL